MSAIDNETFADLVREYTPNLYRLTLGILHNREDAEDAVSESILKAYEKIHTLISWVIQI